MRDTNKNKEYFLNYIEKRIEGIKDLENMFENNEVNKVNLMGKILGGHYYQVLIANYNLGQDMFTHDIQDDFNNVCNQYYSYWEENANNISAKVKGKIVTLSQYGFSGFLHYAELLSFAIVLNASDETFNKLVSIIDKDGVKDFFYEFLIKSRLKDRPDITEESYKVAFHVNDRLGLLKEAALEEDLKKAEEKLKVFLEKYWYKSLKGTVLYNQHNKDLGLYNGYWCFPAAAIVKTKGLDDSSFRDNPYYPKDLVN